MFENVPSTTAEAVCFMRAHEHLRARHRVVDDPFAHWFLHPVARAALASERMLPRLGRYAERASDGLLQFVVARHRYMDDALRSALRRGVDQVVLLGAGYDMRAYRLAVELRGRPVFEVDHPATSRRKARIVAQHRDELPDTNVTRVEVDFEKQSFRTELRKAGFKERRRTFFVWEGVSMYLTRSSVVKTLQTLRAMSAAGSHLVLDLWYLPDEHDLLAAARRLSPNLLGLLGEPITFGIHPDDVGPFFERCAFRVRDISGPPELRTRYFGKKTHLYPTNYVLHAVTAPKRVARPAATPTRAKK
jgi:methyltransferase (TIGR00027 family)